MENLQIISKLNETTLELATETGNSVPSVTFYGGKTEDKLSEILKTLSPQGKVLVLYTEKVFNEIGKALTATIKAVGGKPFNVVVDEDVDTVKATGDIMRAPEDVRLIVCPDYALNTLSVYCASLMQLPLVYIVQNSEIDGILSPNLYVDNGNLVEPVYATLERHVILDFDRIYSNFDVAGAYLNIESKLFAFTDYRISYRVKDELPLKKQYSLAKSALTAVYEIMDIEMGDRASELLYNALVMEIANLYADGKLFDFSSLRIVEFLTCKEKRMSKAQKLKAFGVLAGIYQLYFSGEYKELPTITDYLSRAEYVAKATGNDGKIFMEGLNAQVELLSGKKKIIEGICAKLKGEIKAHNVNAVKIKETFYALGGAVDNDNTNFNLSIKHCGDTPYSINGISLAREKGITEYV